jgi:hypothetical protein
VPVVSEDQEPYLPTTDYSSAEESLTTPPYYISYKEVNFKLCTTTSRVGYYKEKGTERTFRLSYFPRVEGPIRIFNLHCTDDCLLHIPSSQDGHRLLTLVEECYKVESESIIQTFTKPKDSSLLHLQLLKPPGTKLIFDRELRFNLNDSRSWPFIIKELPDSGTIINSYLSAPDIAKYTKHRYLDWVAAGGQKGNQEFFIDLWSH